MGRNNYENIRTICTGGINEQDDQASLDQCSVATNVWAPEGKLIGRPGYVGVAYRQLYGQYQFDLIHSSLGVVGPLVIKETPIGTFQVTNDLSSLAIGRRWYLGFTGITGVALSFADIKELVTKFDFASSTRNSNAGYAAIEYWNGTTWAPLPGIESSTTYAKAAEHISNNAGTPHIISCVLPTDFTTLNPTQLDSALTGYADTYFLRFTVQDNNLDGATSINLAALAHTFADVTSGSDATPIIQTGVFSIITMPAGKRFSFVTVPTAGTPLIYNLAWDSINAALSYTQNLSMSYTGGDILNSSFKWAIVPEYNEAYTTVGYQPVVFDLVANTFTDAAIESDPLFVGVGTPTDPNVTPYLLNWPKSKYLVYANSEMWAANLDTDPNAIRWSRPNTFDTTAKTWPVASLERIQANDGSAITGLHLFNQQMHVFTSESIWRMVDLGDSELGLKLYAPEKIVVGVGCIADGSVEDIRGNLIFLGEDGIYVFDGTPGIKKATVDHQTGADRLVETMKMISRGTAARSVSVHWKQKSLYMLAVPTNGSPINDKVLVWDYKHDTWWVWDNINVQSWAVDADAVDELIYFLDSYGRVYQLNVGLTDNGTAITHTVTTARLGAAINEKKVLRSVESYSTNDTGSFSLEILGNDEASVSGSTVDYSDVNEPTWTDLVYAVDNYTPVRRRSRRLMFRETMDWFKIKATHSVKGAPFELSRFDAGFLRLGNR